MELIDRKIRIEMHAGRRDVGLTRRKQRPEHGDEEARNEDQRSSRPGPDSKKGQGPEDRDAAQEKCEEPGVDDPGAKQIHGIQRSTGGAGIAFASTGRAARR